MVRSRAKVNISLSLHREQVSDTIEKSKKNRKTEKQLLQLKPGIYNQIKDEASYNYLSHLGVNSISWAWKSR